MKNYIRLQYDLFSAASSVAGAASAIPGPVGLGAAALQAGLGVAQAISGQKDVNKYLPQLKPFQTPEQIYKIVNATAARQGGLDPETLAYLTGEVDRGFGSSVAAATRLGADPNELSTLLQQKVDATFKIGAENQLENLRMFDKYLSTNQLLADNKAAEQLSRQNLIKDKLQKAGVDKMSGLQNIAGGINTAISTLSSDQIAQLYKLINKSNGGTTIPPLTIPGISRQSVGSLQLNPTPSSIYDTPETPTPR